MSLYSTAFHLRKPAVLVLNALKVFQQIVKRK
jgi:hypothetical protein